MIGASKKVLAPCDYHGACLGGSLYGLTENAERKADHLSIMNSNLPASTTTIPSISLVNHLYSSFSSATQRFSEWISEIKPGSLP